MSYHNPSLGGRKWDQQIQDVDHSMLSRFRKKSAMSLRVGNALERSGPALRKGGGLFFCAQKVSQSQESHDRFPWGAAMWRNGLGDFLSRALMAFQTRRGEGVSLFSPPEVAVQVVKIACERPDTIGRSLSQWDCTELARHLEREGVVESISGRTVQRILANHKLKPWRNHMWLNKKKPRDAEFYRQVLHIVDLYTRPAKPTELYLSYDEKTSLQPRPRKHKTKPARPENQPNLCEHEYARDGALQLFAAFNIRSGIVYGQCHDRKRQHEFIQFLEHLDATIPETITTVHMIGDNLKVHSGKEVQKWLLDHPRFLFHFTPVHCSWLNQIEQWFSILQRKRFRLIDFASKEDLAKKIMQFIDEWNEHAHPFNWTTKSVAKVMAKAPKEMRIAA
jgi:transposase